jgi:hypothetical protein
MTHDGQDLRSPVHSASNEIEEANEDDVKTPAATQDRADPFGLEEQDSPSRQVTPSANVVSDPFGMPTTTQSEQGGFSAGFDDGFGDDFSKANAALKRRRSARPGAFPCLTIWLPHPRQLRISRKLSTIEETLLPLSPLQCDPTSMLKVDPSRQRSLRPTAWSIPQRPSYLLPLP